MTRGYPYHDVTFGDGDSVEIYKNDSSDVIPSNIVMNPLSSSQGAPILAETGPLN